MRRFVLLLICSTLICCQENSKIETVENSETESAGIRIEPATSTSLIVLGIGQDAGIPQAGSQRPNAAEKFLNPDPLDAVVALGLIDAQNQQSYLFEATPDLPKQLYWLQQATPGNPVFPSGIFLTHAHIGHYTGLMYLGKESASTQGIATYTMPKMAGFLKTNGPWDALVSNGNIVLKPLDSTTVQLAKDLSVTALKVPHRDEYSETVGYHIQGPNKSALFIPDIDKWHLWEESIVEWVKRVDYAFLDATFFSGDELGGRDMSQIPHPSVQESMELFKGLNETDKQKVYFIHLNHTNPLLDENSAQTKEVLRKGFNIARPLQKFAM